MNLEQAKQRIEIIKKELLLLNKAYFTNDTEIVPESVRDSLKRELILLEKEYPQLQTQDSPSQIIGSELNKKFEKISHLQKKESLSDVFSFEEIKEWNERIFRILPEEFHYFCELKLDGLNITLRYKEGVLIQALTRGNGLEGENVTHTVKTISSIPHQLKKKFSGEISGEAFFMKKDFEALNQNSDKTFANPRNAVAGTIRQLDPEFAKQRNMSFYPYNVFPLTEVSQEKSQIFLQSLGFPIEKKSKSIQSLSEINDYIKYWTKNRSRLDFEIDGIVVKVQKFSQQKVLGSTSKSPRWAIAYKFPAEIAQSEVLSIDLQVGRTGAITPVANLRPTLLAATTVSRATLHNAREIKRKDIRIGDTVMIRKAGDIIPEVIEVIHEMRPENSQIFIFPSHCPVCSEKLIHYEGEVVIRCINSKCQSIHIEELKHFVSRPCANIEGLGEEVLIAFVENKLIEDFADIYSLTKDELLMLPFFKEKKAEKILLSIQNAKKINLERFIFSLGIRFVGKETSFIFAQFFISQLDIQKKIISQKIKDTDLQMNLFQEETIGKKNTVEVEEKYFSLEQFFQKIQMMKEQDLLDLDGVGEKSAKSFYVYFQTENRLHVMKKLIENNVQIEYEEYIQKPQVLKDKTLLITGTLTSMSRDQLKQHIKEAGGKVVSAMSKNVDILIAGNNPGSKLDKAQKMNKEIWNEDFVKKMLI
jgi:DNA ligase (NAD+)